MVELYSGSVERRQVLSRSCPLMVTYPNEHKAGLSVKVVFIRENGM